MPWFEPARDIIRSSHSDGSGGGGDGAVVWDLIAELASAKPAQRRRAVERMQEHNRTDLAPFLINLLKSVNPGVRRDATETLGLIGYEIVEDAGRGLAALLYDPERDVREEAVVAIWRLGCANAVADLQKALCFDKEESVRRAIARMLSAFDDASHASFFEYALADADRVVRANAAVGLGLGGHAAISERLLRLLESETENVARAGFLCGLWLLGCGPQMLEDFLRMAHEPGLVSEMCQWIHSYLDRAPVSDAAQKDLARIRTAMRTHAEAAELVERIALWQGERMIEKVKSAEAGGSEG